jgi:xanthine dehydrogenase accessory factor
MDTIQKSKHIYAQLLKAMKENQPCVLATVTNSQGSTPQKPGSSAIFNKKGLIAGTVGGGAVELATGEIASESIRSKKSGYYTFDLENDITDLEAAICGGGMGILVDAAPEKHIEVFQSLSTAEMNRIPGVLATLCGSGPKECSGFDRFWITSETLGNFSGRLPEEIIAAITEMLTNSNPDEFREIVLSGEEKEEPKMAFLESIVPLPQLIIAGAGHVGKALSHLAKLLDFEVIVWDDRVAFANKTNLPDADKILSGKLDESFENLTIANDTFIVIVTRGHKNDADVLRKFIGSDAGYIGMIGSRRKIAQVCESFLNKGWATIEQWERIYAPIGSEIGSKTVQEIAVSIAAQLVQVRNEIKRGWTSGITQIYR